MCGASRRLWGRWINTCSVIICISLVLHAGSYGQTAATETDSPKNQASNSPKYAQTKQRDTKQPPPIVKVAPSSESDQKPAQVTEQHDSHPTPDWWLIGVTFLLVIATGGLVYYARDTAIRQLRAYVFINSAIITDMDDPDGVRVTIEIKNSGLTPAYEVKSVATMRIFDFPVRAFPSSPPVEKGRTKVDLPTGGTLGSQMSYRVITPDEKAKIRNGAQAIYLWGEVRYKDAFKIGRVSKFRYMSGGDLGVCIGGMFACEEGNEST